MSLSTGAYSSIAPTEITGTNSATGNDGADVMAGSFQSQSFWTNTSYLGFNSAEVGDPLHYAWDFSRVVSDGYPRLKNNP
jgi:hypothetical protein